MRTFLYFRADFGLTGGALMTDERHSWQPHSSSNFSSNYVVTNFPGPIAAFMARIIRYASFAGSPTSTTG
jgi:hypothetical protein